MHVAEATRYVYGRNGRLSDDDDIFTATYYVQIHELRRCWVPSVRRLERIQVSRRHDWMHVKHAHMIMLSGCFSFRYLRLQRLLGLLDKDAYRSDPQQK